MNFDRPWHQWYEPGIPTKLNYSKVPLKNQFNDWVAKQPEKPMIFFMDQTLTYSQVDAAAKRIANALQAMGVTQGDRVSITLPNIPQFVISVHACLKMGAIIVPANPLYTERELSHQYQDSGSETVICLAPYAEKVIRFLNDPEHCVKRVITVEVPGLKAAPPSGPDIYDFSHLIAKSVDREPVIETTVDDLVLLLYTGGTTGVPKGCRITNANLIAISNCYMTCAQSLIKPEEYKSLCTVPLYHIYGFNSQINFCIYTGGSMVLLPEVTPTAILDAINQHQPTFWPTVPALIQALTMMPELPDSKVQSIQCILCGSAPLPVEVMKTFERISGAKILEGFGSSETTNGITTNPINRQKAGSVGIPFPDHDIKIMDLENGTVEMPLGEPGEMVFRGPVVVDGYWNKPEETAQAFRDGWFYTGDIGYLDEDHFCFIVDRKKDMIICSGFNVYPREIDEVLHTHPKILEAGTIGIPDQKRGETVKAFVVCKPGESLSEEEVIEFCRQHLAAYKIPRRVTFINELPRTSVKKVDRKELRLMEPIKEA